MHPDDAFLSRIGHLSIPALWEADDPVVLLETLGYAVHYARRPFQSTSVALDLLLEDADGNHYGIRLGGYTHNGNDIWWGHKNYRLVLLHAAFSVPVAGPAPSLGDLAQSLAQPLTETGAGTFETREGDNWACGVLLLAALDLLPVGDRPAHETLIALKNTRLLAALAALRNWMDNREDDDWKEQAIAHLTQAVRTLWPTMDLAPNLPDEDLAADLLTSPRSQWQRAAEQTLAEAASLEGSLTYWALVQQWKDRAPAGVTLPNPTR